VSESPQRPGVKVLQLATYNVSFVDEFFLLHLLTLPLIVAFPAPLQCSARTKCLALIPKDEHACRVKMELKMKAAACNSRTVSVAGVFLVVLTLSPTPAMVLPVVHFCFSV
jgi:hypothetical protein